MLFKKETLSMLPYNCGSIIICFEYTMNCDTLIAWMQVKKRLHFYCEVQYTYIKELHGSIRTSLSFYQWQQKTMLTL